MFKFGDLVVIKTRHNPIPRKAVVIEDESGDGFVYVMHERNRAQEMINVNCVSHCTATDAEILFWLFECGGLAKLNEFAKSNPVNASNYRETVRYLQKSGQSDLPVIDAVVHHK